LILQINLKLHFKKKVVELVKELSRHVAAGTPTSPPSTTAPVVETKKAPEYVSWDCDRTMTWIASVCGEKSDFKDRLDGGSLEELVRLRTQDPSHHFISFLLTHVTGRLASALAFSKALTTLR